MQTVIDSDLLISIVVIPSRTAFPDKSPAPKGPYLLPQRAEDYQEVISPSPPRSSGGGKQKGPHRNR
jgi:hypothetical protein